MYHLENCHICGSIPEWIKEDTYGGIFHYLRCPKCRDKGNGRLRTRSMKTKRIVVKEWNEMTVFYKGMDTKENTWPDWLKKKEGIL